MRLRTFSKLLLVAAVATYIFRKRRSPAPAVRDDLAPDPTDPVQTLDPVAAFQVDELDVDAQIKLDLETAADLAALDDEFDTAELDTPSLGDLDTIELSSRAEDGELYGVPPRAVDLPDDDRAFEDGENWVEALQASSVENGAEPEREIDLDLDDVDDLFDPPLSSDSRDTPVADRGSGGPRGL